MIQEQSIKQEQAEPSAGYIPLSFFIKEKDHFFWETEIEAFYKTKIGAEELAAAVQKFDLEMEDEISKEGMPKVGPAKKRLTAWLNKWIEKMNSPKPPRVQKKQVHKYDWDYILLRYNESEKDDFFRTEVDAAYFSEQTNGGHRIVIDVPENPKLWMLPILRWSDNGTYKVRTILAMDNLWELGQSDLDRWQNHCLRWEEEERILEKISRMPVHLRPKVEEEAAAEAAGVIDEEGYDNESRKQEKAIDAVAALFPKDHPAVMELYREVQMQAQMNLEHEIEASNL